MTKLHQYRGFLTSEQIAAGITAAQKNARRLAEDADILLAAGRFPTACSLAILSFEESGKSTILRKMGPATTQKEIQVLWKSYRRHLDKHLITLVPERVYKGARHLSEFSDCVTDAGLEEREIYDAVKQLGFYTDCLGKANWSVPSEIIEEGLARSIVRMASVMSGGNHAVTTREMELWTMHMQDGYTRKNLLAWATAMEAEGLQPEGFTDELARFTIGF